jgi:HEAT repeat protein
MDAFRAGSRMIAGHVYVSQPTIAEALIKVGDKSVVPELKELLHSNSREMRDDAAWVLAKLGDDEGIAQVMEDARDKSITGRALAGTERSQTTLRQIEQDRYCAVRTLGMIGDARAVPLLSELVHESRLTAGAAYALSQIGDSRGIPALSEELQTVRGQSRGSVAEALAKLGDPRGVAALVAILRDLTTNTYFRESAAVSLGRLKAMSAKAALIEALHDPAIEVRIGAAEGLGELGDASAIPALTEALKDATQTRTHWQPITLHDAAEAALAQIRATK